LIIDAHQHLWQISRSSHEWPTPDLSAIYRDYGTDDLASTCAGLNIAGTVLVQAQPSEGDTHWMLAVAAATPLIKAVVGWTDLAAPEASGRITELAKLPKLKGLRPMLQALPQDDWILRDEVQPALEVMAAHGLSLDALVLTRHLPMIDQLAKRHPSLAIIIDHGAKPPLGHPQDMAQWRDGITAVAQNAHVTCKLSGLLTEMLPEQTEAGLAPCADHLLAAFGPGRLMWGSDWPVVLLRHSYRHWFDWTQAWLADKPETTHALIMGGTAHKIYNL
jgi:L-fuconolactonase